jgi:hypothetical protein
MTVDEAIEFLRSRGWRVWEINQCGGIYGLVKPNNAVGWDRDREGLCRLAEAVKQAEAEARQC